MKKSLFILFVLFAGLSTMAQTSDELAMVRQVFGQEKKEIVKQFLDLSAADSAKFWPLYDEYSAKRKSLSDDRIAILKDYASQYEGITNEQAKKLGDRYFKNESDILKLQHNFYNKMSKSVSALKATQFMQTESYLQTQLRAAIQDEIPFIGEFDKAQKH